MGLNLANPAKGEMDWDKKLADNFNAIVQYANANDLSISQVLAALDNKVEKEGYISSGDITQIINMPSGFYIVGMPVTGMPVDNRNYNIIWSSPHAEVKCLLAFTQEGSHENGVSYQRTCFGAGSTLWWSPWKRLATAEPPAMYDLPLANGYALTYYASYYYKTQDNEVTIIGSALKDGGISNGEVFANLPIGFRPARVVESPAIFYDDSGITNPGFVTINPDGTMYLYQISNPKRVQFNVTFLAEA